MKGKLLILLAFLGFLFTNCSEPVVEIKDTIFAAQDNSEAETSFFATFEVAYDVVSTNGKFLKAQSTILPASTILTFEDSVFTDGDGISLIIDFGPLGETEPKGVLCQDGRYRAGKMRVETNNKFIHPDLKVKVSIDPSDSFYTGNGSTMNQVVGITTISKKSLNEIQIEITEARLILPDYELPWQSLRIIKMVYDAGVGIWSDIYEVTGSASGKNRFGESYEVEIESPLVKKMEVGCARTFIAGKLKISETNSNKVIQIDYDPYLNQACDMFAEANIGGKKVIFKVK